MLDVCVLGQPGMDVLSRVRQMKPEETPQEPLKTPCRICLGAKTWMQHRESGDLRIMWREPCFHCKGSGYEEKP